MSKARALFGWSERERLRRYLTAWETNWRSIQSTLQQYALGWRPHRLSPPINCRPIS